MGPVACLAKNVVFVSIPQVSAEIGWEPLASVESLVYTVEATTENDRKLHTSSVDTPPMLGCTGAEVWRSGTATEA